MAVKKPLVLTAGQIQELQSGDEINIDASDVTTGTIATARLGSGTADATTFLAGDQSYKTPPYPVTSVAGKTGAVTLTNTDVGAAATSHTHAATDITSGTIATARLGSGTANNTTFLRGDQTWATPAGGVTGFTGSQNSTSPNNTVNASRLLVDATSTNADFVLQPKGTGAVLAQLPDSTATGGNKRGANALDLQTSRSTAAQVASGARSVAVGANNEASGADSIAIGYQNGAAYSGNVCIGNNCSGFAVYGIAIGTYAAIGAQYSNAIGRNVDGNHENATAMGYQAGTSFGGSVAHASGRFAANGDAQYERAIIRRITTNATPAELFTDGSSLRILIPNDTCYAFQALIVARRADADNECAAYKVEGCIDRNAGTVAAVGTITVTVIAEDTAAWNLTCAADDTNKALTFTATGEANKTIRWVGVVNITKVTG